MNISSRCEYGCRAVLELALHGQADTPMPASAIAEKRAIPEKYLVHILLQLKRAGIVRSVRGSQGGYMLGKAPEEITLCAIVEAIDGAILYPLPINDAAGADLQPTWQGVASEVRRVLENISVRDILDQDASAHMYYI
jgi:Rrf2 family cysteine metabolism transcriptional repressor